MANRVHRASAVFASCLVVSGVLVAGAACWGAPASAEAATAPVPSPAVYAGPPVRVVPVSAGTPVPAEPGPALPASLAANVIAEPAPSPSPPVPAPAPVKVAAAPRPRPPAMSALEEKVRRDALASAMQASLAGVLAPDNPGWTREALAAGRSMMARQHAELDGTQIVLLVDRAPAVQRLWIVMAGPGRPWEALGSVHVSTGKPGRKEHFRTPVGVFVNSSDILGYRALGTYNENHIRGNGLKGMRVWDFGWQTTDDWRARNAPMAVRMEMHATDPANLEARLGRWDSEGCIRIHSRVNSFLDQQGLIDAKLRDAAQTDRRFAALLPKGVAPNPLAGSTVVVVDTSDPAALPSDPVKANLMEHPMPIPPVAGLDSAG